MGTVMFIIGHGVLQLATIHGGELGAELTIGAREQRTKHGGLVVKSTRAM